jgi:hypothetical protein
MIIKALGSYSVILTIMLVICGLQWFDNSTKLAVLTEAFREQAFLATSFQHKVEVQAERYAVLLRNRKVIQDKVYEQKTEINRYKGREQVVYDKPGLVERLEGKAMTKFFKSVESDDN